MSNDRLLISQDGSHTILSDSFGVTYHSKYGAIQETEVVFINAGLKYAADTGIKDIYILEMGFGTGLNALMTYLYDVHPAISIHYHTIEAYPIRIEEATALNYPKVLDLNEEQRQAFIKMHEVENNHKIELKSNFNFTKHLTFLEDFTTDQKFDVIYYDAFAPNAQEHLWTPEMMLKLSTLSHEGCAIVTYCAKGSVKRALRAAGFRVEGLPGPLGKREMTRGIYNPE